MGKNYKEQAVYDYVHDNKEVKGKLLRKIMNKFGRHNFDWAEDRALTLFKKEKQSKKELKDELNEL